jgi:DNA (cytosine-5)-methyltransferase 1
MRSQGQTRLEGADGTRIGASPTISKVTLLMREHAGDPPPRVAEFFAGIGLVRAALQRCGFEVVWANDLEPIKLAMYEANFSGSDFHLGDIRAVGGADIPDIELATASFPCTDLSLAGNQAGLAGNESSMFWEFARVLEEMEDRRPDVVLLENVPSFGTLRGGRDLYSAIARLNELGYWCDALVIDARLFVPQSRPRLFVIGSRTQISDKADFSPSQIRPTWIGEFVAAYPDLNMQAARLPAPADRGADLSSVVQRLRPENPRWWDPIRTEGFTASLSSIQLDRLRKMTRSRRKCWATTYRRTRHGRAVWEIRADSISGCLRTARGGSSKQAIVEAGRGAFRVRWMTPREYARLQGAPDYQFLDVTDSQALFGFGDAVCVPAVEWVAAHYLVPLVTGDLGSGEEILAKVA